MLDLCYTTVMDKTVFNIEEVKNDLLKNNEGEIIMEMDWKEKIAIIWLNHVEKRNSITGMYVCMWIHFGC